MAVDTLERTGVSSFKTNSVDRLSIVKGSQLELISHAVAVGDTPLWEVWSALFGDSYGSPGSSQGEWEAFTALNGIDALIFTEAESVLFRMPAVVTSVSDAGGGYVEVAVSVVLGPNWHNVSWGSTINVLPPLRGDASGTLGPTGTAVVNYVAPDDVFNAGEKIKEIQLTGVDPSSTKVIIRDVSGNILWEGRPNEYGYITPHFVDAYWEKATLGSPGCPAAARADFSDEFWWQGTHPDSTRITDPPAESYRHHDGEGDLTIPETRLCRGFYPDGPGINGDPLRIPGHPSGMREGQTFDTALCVFDGATKRQVVWDFDVDSSFITFDEPGVPPRSCAGDGYQQIWFYADVDPLDARIKDMRGRDTEPLYCLKDNNGDVSFDYDIEPFWLVGESLDDPLRELVAGYASDGRRCTQQGIWSEVPISQDDVLRVYWRLAFKAPQTGRNLVTAFWRDQDYDSFTGSLNARPLFVNDQLIGRRKIYSKLFNDGLTGGEPAYNCSGHNAFGTWFMFLLQTHDGVELKDGDIKFMVSQDYGGAVNIELFTGTDPEEGSDLTYLDHVCNQSGDPEIVISLPASPGYNAIYARVTNVDYGQAHNLHARVENISCRYREGNSIATAIDL